MELHPNESFTYFCGTNAQNAKVRTIEVRKHQRVIVECACDGTMEFECPGNITSTRTVKVPCNTWVTVFCSNK